MGAEVEADTDAESHCGRLDELLRKPVGELLKVQSLAAVVSSGATGTVPKDVQDCPGKLEN